MSDAGQDERIRLTRELRQRLESLRRAGLDRLPVSAVRGPLPPARGFSANPAPAYAPKQPWTGPVEPTAPPEDRRPQLTPAPVETPRFAPGPEKTQAPPAYPPPAPSLFGDPDPVLPLVPAGERSARLAAMADEVAACTRCPLLASTRTRTVFGTGSPTARLMFVGEAPGADEDRTGLPFVGRAGALLTDMITKGMGLTRDDVYIANVLKSRPPENRNPLPDEVANCLPFLERQIAIVRPEFLCVLGKVAASALLETALPLGKLRGRWHRFRAIPTVVTYHPAFLLRNPASKKEAWDDLQMLMKAMGLTPPGRNKS